MSVFMCVQDITTFQSRTTHSTLLTLTFVFIYSIRQLTIYDNDDDEQNGTEFALLLSYAFAHTTHCLNSTGTKEKVDKKKTSSSI